MDALTLALLLAAALCHATWNLSLKRCADKDMAAWWSLVVTAPLALPAVLSGGVPLSMWPFLLASTACQAGYYYALTSAYRDGDFSLVYPIARGTAPVLVLLWSTLFLHEQARPLGLVGIALIVLGVATVGGLWQRLRRVPRALQLSKTPGPPAVEDAASQAALALENGAGVTRWKLGGLGAAFLVALCVSGYSTIDGAAVKRCDPLAYTACIYALTALAVTPLLARRPWPRLQAGFAAHKSSIWTIAVLSLVSYGLVLVAYSRGSVSYAAAGREMSIVFGALAGWRFLGEPMGVHRLAGACLIFCGILAIAIWG
jgi:drug/metabolite transporter (DMT)-like permease